jgi:hypothetical protein
MVWLLAYQDPVGLVEEKTSDKIAVMYTTYTHVLLPSFLFKILNQLKTFIIPYMFWKKIFKNYVNLFYYSSINLFVTKLCMKKKVLSVSKNLANSLWFAAVLGTKLYLVEFMRELLPRNSFGRPLKTIISLTVKGENLHFSFNIVIVDHICSMESCVLLFRDDHLSKVKLSKQVIYYAYINM